MTNDESVLTRRSVVAGAVVAAAALSACSTYGKENAAPAPNPAPTGNPTTPGRPAGNALAKTADIPVGGGVIVGDTVVTQPSAGTFVGLSSTCTHAGCTVASVSGGTINCPCHGSKYKLDGTVSNGPATKALAAKTVRVVGDSVVPG
ncbi:ubiquinol-cytochrome c reductase iron-sulfur subunit [Nocardia sp. NPDC051052]|uniref:ubiquinol-cytochrome c reductase iron-sulfur subunit n=1 Tax=Nocardia sp. NPDC051052 TaxID=3364322 RepID=UPI003796D8B2